MTSPLRLIQTAPRATLYDPLIDEYDVWGRELRGFRPSTIRVRREVLIRLSVFLGIPLAEATVPDLLRWERERVAGRSPETRRAYVSHVRAWYKWALKMRYVADDPSECLTRPRLVRGLPRPVSDVDFRRATEGARPKMAAWLFLAGFCGLRCQEIAGLQWGDLMLTPEGNTLLIREGKGGKERVVPVPTPVLEALVAFGRKRSGPMFLGLDGRQMQPSSVSSNINAHLQRRGIPVTAHQFRHRFATTAYQLTKDIRLVQELMGHESPTTTARYAAYDKSQTVDMVAAMEQQWQDQQMVVDAPTRRTDEVVDAEPARRPTVDELGLLTSRRPQD